MAWILLRSGHQIARIIIKIVKTCSFWHPLPKRALHADAPPGSFPNKSCLYGQLSSSCFARLNDVRANIVWSWFQNDHMANVLRMISTFICKYPPDIIPERCCCMTKILQLAILTWLSWVRGGGRVPGDFQTGNFCWPSIGKRSAREMG